MIKEINLTQFKGFRDFKVALKPFTNLVGLNSRGKTSVLQAIQLVHELLRFTFNQASGTDFSSIRWTTGPQEVLARYSPNDPTAVWFGRNTTSPCSISLAMDGDVILSASVIGPNRYDLDLYVSGKRMRDHVIGDAEKSVVRALLDEKALYVPPLAAATGAEHFQTYPNFLQQLQEGKRSENWRNSLYWLYNDGDKSRFKNVVDLVSKYIDDAEILPPRLSHEHQATVVIEFLQDAQKFDIGLSGAGMRSLLNLAAVLMLSDSRLLLLDEPDAHLHSSLQRAISRMLLDYAWESGAQIICASHAPDFLAEIPLDSIMWIDRKEAVGKPIDILGKVLVDLGALTGSEAVYADAANAVLFIEGSTDRRVLSGAFKLCNLPDATADPKVILAKLPSGKSSAAGVEMLPGVLEGLVGRRVRVACLLDNDWELFPDGDGQSGSICAMCLKRKEIENYLIDAEVFARAAFAASNRRAAASPPSDVPTHSDVTTKVAELCDSHRDLVRSHLTWRYRETLPAKLDRTTKEDQASKWFDANWNNAEWRMRVVPGKMVLASLRRWCQDRYKITITEKLLLDALGTPPSDLREVLTLVATSIYGVAKAIANS